MSGTTGSGRGSLWDRVWPPLGVSLLFFGVWQACCVVFRIPSFVLPTPVAVAGAASAKWYELGSATLLTATAATLGLALSLLVGAAVAVAFSQSRALSRSLFPYAIFLQTVPIIAIAPLIVIWFGQGLFSVVLVSFMVGLFPIITNGTTGLTRIDPSLLDLFALYRASRFHVLIKLRLPGSVPFFVVGAKVSSGLCVIGAIVGEFFAGSAERYGLGYVIELTSGQLRTADLFAAVFASTLLGLSMFLGVGALGDLLARRFRAREVIR